MSYRDHESHGHCGQFVFGEMHVKQRLMIGALGLGLVLAVCGSARADEEYDKLVGEFEESQDAWYELRKQAEDDDNGSADTSKLPPHPATKFMKKFKRYAKKRAGRPDAIPALVWIVQNAGSAEPPEASGKPPSARWALDRLTEDHAAQAEIEDALPKLKYAMYQVDRVLLISLYQRIIRENAKKEVLALATFNLAFTLYQGSPLDEIGEEADRLRAKKLFMKVAGAYPDTDAADDAKGYLFEIDHLQVGMVAPDFEGTDADGRAITLSQFRGQVVVVVFWGFW